MTWIWIFFMKIPKNQQDVKLVGHGADLVKNEKVGRRRKQGNKKSSVKRLPAPKAEVGEKNIDLKKRVACGFAYPPEGFSSTRNANNKVSSVSIILKKGILTFKSHKGAHDWVAQNPNYLYNLEELSQDKDTEDNTEVKTEDNTKDNTEDGVPSQEASSSRDLIKL